MKFTDYLCGALIRLGLIRAHAMQGGSIAHVIDSHIELGGEVYFHHHEQSAALAAMADGAIGRKPGLLLVTTGPAITNSLTGVVAAWQDSIPLVVVSGQTRQSEMSYGTKLRQVGSQELATLDLVSSITKSQHLITSDEELSNIEEIVDHASDGRPGPVWIDIPVDVQIREITNL